MSQRPRILIAQQQRLALNASLQASIRLLRSDTAGIVRYLEEQAAENPHLRLVPPEPASLGDWLPRWSGVLTFGKRGAAPEISERSDRDAAVPSLIAHVMAAIRAMTLPRASLPIVLALVEALEPSGWIGRSLSSVAEETGRPEGEVLAVLARLQSIEPAGLFARNLAECLALQAKDQGQMDAIMATILQNLDLLAAGDTARLARLCGCAEPEVVRRFRSIRAMNPKPGSSFAGVDPVLAREPDLLARPLKNGRWQISLNRSALPSVEIDSNATPPQAEALTKAKSLQYMLKARNDTLLRVGRTIAERQVAALTHGRGALCPMTMAEVAEAVGLHVSTVSRVVAGASMDSPKGTWLLRQMFSGARGKAEDRTHTGPAPVPVAAAALRHRMGQIIAAEDPARPLSDAALADALERETGVRLARRTLAQYREAEGIPPSHRRKRRLGRLSGQSLSRRKPGSSAQ